MGKLLQLLGNLEGLLLEILMEANNQHEKDIAKKQRY
jgi:hypothetical protein